MKQSAKDIAISVLGDLGIYSPYTNGFKANKRRITFFENYAGFWLDQEDEAYQKMKEIEEKYNIMVYAVTHEYLEFGECWDFLFVPNSCKGKEEVITHYKNNSNIVYAYVWNKTDEYLSEFGDILVASFGGGIKRIG